MQNYYFEVVCPFALNIQSYGYTAKNKLSLTENEVYKKVSFSFCLSKSYTICMVLQRPIIALLRGE